MRIDMDNQAIQEMLDNLDMQLAAGKIDLQTYRRLTAKWQTKLQQPVPGVMEAASTPFEGAQQVLAQIACPECSAPLEETQVSPGSVVRCGFCRATFTFQHAQERTERAGHELQRWLEKMVLEAGSSGTVDAASRRYIFNERLYPALQLEYRRGMEPYESALEHPFAYLDILQEVPGYRAAEHVLLCNPEAVPGMRALSLKVNSPLVSGFALGEDNRKLRDLDIGTTSLVHLANVAKLLSQPSPETYASAKQNLLAMSKEYDDYISMSLDPGYREYIQAIRARIGAIARAFDVLVIISTPGADFASQVYLEELDAAQQELERARELAGSSTHSPLAVLPLRTGLERDQKSLALLGAVLHSYHVASRNRPLAFSTYYADLKPMLAIIRPNCGDPVQLVDACQQIEAIIRASRGQGTLYRLDDWNRCEKQIDAGRNRSLFSSEQVQEQQHYWHPYWYATIRYATKKGRLRVSGVEKTAYGLIDAVSKKASPLIVLDDAPRYSAMSQALEQPRHGDGKPFLPSRMPSSAAEQSIANKTKRVENLLNARVSVAGLLYLPAVLVEYESKSGNRTALYIDEKASEQGEEIGRLLAHVRPFFERYG